MPAPELVKHVQDMETCRLTVYRDPVGLPTIGWGHLLTSFSVPPITQEQADLMLSQDLAGAEREVLALHPDLSGARLAAITDFVFNVGVRKYRTSTLRRTVNAQRWDRAAEEVQKWIWATKPDGTKVKEPGLVKRRLLTAYWLSHGSFGE
jgi:lysozyme